MLRHAEILGWIVCGKQCIEKTMEFAHAYETDVADFHGLIWTVWTGVPEGMSVVRISKSELFAKDVVVGHDYAAGSKKEFTMPFGGRATKMAKGASTAVLGLVPRRLSFATTTAGRSI